MNQSASLVRYDNPVLVVTTKGGKQGGKKLPPVESKVCFCASRQILFPWQPLHLPPEPTPWETRAEGSQVKNRSVLPWHVME